VVAEWYDGTNGWAIGEEREYDNLDAQDWDDAQHLYHLLENEVAPAYYDRDASGVSARWVAIAKAAIMTCAPEFSTQRMLKEYVNRLYLPVANHNASCVKSPPYHSNVEGGLFCWRDVDPPHAADLQWFFARCACQAWVRTRSGTAFDNPHHGAWFEGWFVDTHDVV
jgi:glucan phosphorylase